MTERQIQAQAASTNSVGNQIVDALKLPLQEISGAVKQVSGNQGDAVNKLLTDTMAAMTAQIRDLFGGQIDGIRGMQQQTVDSLNAAAAKLEQLMTDISRKGAEVSETMSERLASTLASMEEKQQAMNLQTQALVDAMRVQAAQSQTATVEGVTTAITKMTAGVAEIVSALQTSIGSASTRDEQRNRQFSEQTAAATTSLTDTTTNLILHTDEAVSAMKQVVEQMKIGTSETVNRMNLGAADMLKAATEMSRAGATTGSALERAQSLVDQLGTASSALTGATSTLNLALVDYKSTRDSMANMVTQLNAIVENAKKEASLTSDVLNRINQAAEKLKEAQLQADKYLSGISETLTTAHQQFGSQIIATLNNINGEFHQHLEKGTRALAGAIDELEQVIDRAGTH